MQQELPNVFERKKIHLLRALEKWRNLLHGSIPVNASHPPPNNLTPSDPDLFCVTFGFKR